MRDLGGVRVPVRLPDLALTDRADGTVWALRNDDSGYIKLVSDPDPFDGYTYPAYDGPGIHLNEHEVRLLVRDGHLGYEPLSYRLSSRPMYAPNKSQARFTDTLYEIKLPDAFYDSYNLAYETQI